MVPSSPFQVHTSRRWLVANPHTVKLHTYITTVKFSVRLELRNGLRLGTVIVQGDIIPQSSLLS